ncbi:hypothetical protein L9F63_018552 [Diploptera punctata]|uniref:Uncharacterized protein n=1 Tax=Diploptera punctata TaxID=6984 RepID=A0AAD8EFM8_DIPPU|nr:hypothetical protein L9F63_018552 [Diploptera punctata]
MNFTFWLSVCLAPSLLLTLWEISKKYSADEIPASTGLVERFQVLTSTFSWRMPTSFWELTNIESLLFAVYAGYLIILVICYRVITNIRHVNREMEKIIHDGNEQMTACGLLQWSTHLSQTCNKVVSVS